MYTLFQIRTKVNALFFHKNNLPPPAFVYKVGIGNATYI